MGRKSKVKPGQRYGDLTVLQRAFTVHDGQGSPGYVMWMCRCDCGVEKPVRSNNLRSGNTQSCGCRQQRPRQRVNKHTGMVVNG